MSGKILVATDGTAGSAGAIRMAIAHARATHCRLVVITVFQPLPVYAVPLAVEIPDGYPALQEAGAEDLRMQAVEQVREIDPGGDWPVISRIGAPAVVIASHARETQAEAIFVGTGPRLALDRWMRSETAQRIVHLSQVPVLLVPPELTSRPASALAAVDFSEFSLDAARAAARFVKSGGRLHLAHVIWSPSEADALPSLKEYWTTYQKGAEVRLNELAGELRGLSGLTVDSSVCIGDPAEEILALSVRLHADMIVAGSNGYGFVGRLVMGSVSSRLIRGAHTTVLLVPPVSGTGLQESRRESSSLTSLASLEAHAQ